MPQPGVVAFVGEQNTQLRVAAEAELKYLSFLSHDLNNNLSSVTIMLQLLRTRLDTSPALAGRREAPVGPYPPPEQQPEQRDDHAATAAEKVGHVAGVRGRRADARR